MRNPLVRSCPADRWRRTRRSRCGGRRIRVDGWTRLATVVGVAGTLAGARRWPSVRRAAPGERRGTPDPEGRSPVRIRVNPPARPRGPSSTFDVTGPGQSLPAVPAVGSRKPQAAGTCALMRWSPGARDRQPGQGTDPDTSSNPVGGLVGGHGCLDRGRRRSRPPQCQRKPNPPHTWLSPLGPALGGVKADARQADTGRDSRDPTAFEHRSLTMTKTVRQWACQPANTDHAGHGGQRA
jgi:hypothetical protein